MSDFYGLPTRSIGSAHLRVDFLAEAGPRLVRLSLADSTENLLAETPDIYWADRFGKYYLRGGHRLTLAPEALGLSYIPDNEGLIVEDLSDGVRLIGPTEIGLGVSKTIELHLHPDRPALTLRHTIQNEGAEPLEIAPWAITQLRPGGTALLPLRLRGASRGHGQRQEPDRHLALWPYTSWQDERLWFDDDYVWIDARPNPVELKIGALTQGWLGYFTGGVFFLKRFDPHLDRPHPDLNTNAQIYSNQRFVELESLAPLTRLEPGQATIHVERWEIYPC